MRLHLALLVVVGVLGLQTAFADTFSISADNLAGAICSSANPCGTVSVTGTSTLTVNIALNPGFVVFGDAFGFNVVGSTTGVAMSNFSSSLFDGSGGSGTIDGWGTFNFRVDGPPQSSGVQNLSFDITRSPLVFTTPGDIEAGAVGSNIPSFTVFALHIGDRNVLLPDGSPLTGFAA